MAFGIIEQTWKSKQRENPVALINLVLEKSVLIHICHTQYILHEG